ncbi:MAG: hypothetical protein LQ352_007331 [Teloschistes flavicans]|nr:MAG: hypothetical protein LQ352_007331 [Teloschistes flavicans]
MPPAQKEIWNEQNAKSPSGRMTVRELYETIFLKFQADTEPPTSKGHTFPGKRSKYHQICFYLNNVRRPEWNHRSLSELGKELYTPRDVVKELVALYKFEQAESKSAEAQKREFKNPTTNLYRLSKHKGAMVSINTRVERLQNEFDRLVRKHFGDEGFVETAEKLEEQKKLQKHYKNRVRKLRERKGIHWEAYPFKLYIKDHATSADYDIPWSSLWAFLEL